MAATLPSIIAVGKFVLAILALLPLLLFAGLLWNHPPLLAPPGFSERIKTYLGSHVARTGVNSRFPELEAPHFSVPPETLLPLVKQAASELDYTLSGSTATSVQLVVTTPLWRFRDDMEIKVIAVNGGSRLHIESRSRIGRGDLGANSRHILDLLAKIEQLLATRQPPSG